MPDNSDSLRSASCTRHRQARPQTGEPSWTTFSSKCPCSPEDALQWPFLSKILETSLIFMQGDVLILGGINGCQRDIVAITRLCVIVFITARTSR